MGYWCRVCGRVIANERFSRKGRRHHICKDCQKRPKSEREANLREQELWGYLGQSNISQRNRKRLEELARSPDSHHAEMGAVILEIARVKPHRKKRYRYLARHHPRLLRRLKEVTGEGWEEPADPDPLGDVPELIPDTMESFIEPEDLAHQLAFYAEREWEDEENC